MVPGDCCISGSLSRFERCRFLQCVQFLEGYVMGNAVFCRIMLQLCCCRGSAIAWSKMQQFLQFLFALSERFCNWCSLCVVQLLKRCIVLLLCLYKQIIIAIVSGIYWTVLVFLEKSFASQVPANFVFGDSFASQVPAKESKYNLMGFYFQSNFFINSAYENDECWWQMMVSAGGGRRRLTLVVEDGRPRWWW
ncbi:hypothetical protein Patl1_07755 [Pistacia atlantica]|uniref:Uncharacterized protein n=1 Tax=Pistacia atlantica TaxID=434234 RepID=A0ACC1AGP7_9ROSI|nr:hypothetical protein Patl1_07755 [Pistacia atlantica]